MRPKDEAAAVFIMPPLQPSTLYRSMKPIAVNGLTIPHAALDSGVYYYISNISCGVETLY